MGRSENMGNLRKIWKDGIRYLDSPIKGEQKKRNRIIALMERKTVMLLRKAVMEEAGPRTLERILAKCQSKQIVFGGLYFCIIPFVTCWERAPQRVWRAPVQARMRTQRWSGYRRLQAPGWNCKQFYRHSFGNLFSSTWSYALCWWALAGALVQDLQGQGPPPQSHDPPSSSCAAQARFL